MNVYSDGTRLFVADSRNNRILIYSQIPTSNNAAADIVVGQSDFTSMILGNSAQAFAFPYGLLPLESSNSFITSDYGGRRIVVFPLGTRNEIAAAPSLVPTNQVEMVLSATDAKDTMVSESPTFTGASWNPFVANLTFVLSPGDGEKAVYVKFRDAANYVGSILQKNITVDTTAPLPVVIKKVGDVAISTDKSPLTVYYVGTRAFITGIAEPKASVVFSFQSETFSTQADAKGSFFLEVTRPLSTGINAFEYYQQDIVGWKSPTKQLFIITGCQQFFPSELQQTYCPASNGSPMVTVSAVPLPLSGTPAPTVSVTPTAIPEVQYVTVTVIGPDKTPFSDKNVIIGKNSYTTNGRGEVTLPNIVGTYSVTATTDGGNKILGTFSIANEDNAVSVQLTLLPQWYTYITICVSIVVVLLIIFLVQKNRKKRSATE